LDIGTSQLNIPVQPHPSKGVSFAKADATKMEHTPGLKVKKIQQLQDYLNWFFSYRFWDCQNTPHKVNGYA